MKFCFLKSDNPEMKLGMCEAQSVKEPTTEPDNCSVPRMHLAEGGN